MNSRYYISYCSKDFNITKSKASVKYSWASNSVKMSGVEVVKYGSTFLKPFFVLVN